MIIRWEPVTYSRDAVTTDVPGVGRFHVKRRVKNRRAFVLLLNGKEEGVFSDRADALRDAETYIRKLVEATPMTHDPVIDEALADAERRGGSIDEVLDAAEQAIIAAPLPPKAWIIRLNGETVGVCLGSLEQAETVRQRLRTEARENHFDLVYTTLTSVPILEP